MRDSERQLLATLVRLLGNHGEEELSVVVKEVLWDLGAGNTTQHLGDAWAQRRAVTHSALFSTDLQFKRLRYTGLAYYLVGVCGGKKCATRRRPLRLRGVHYAHTQECSRKHHQPAVLVIWHKAMWPNVGNTSGSVAMVVRH